jgi:hypothetical protein
MIKEAGDFLEIIEFCEIEGPKARVSVFQKRVSHLSHPQFNFPKTIVKRSDFRDDLFPNFIMSADQPTHSGYVITCDNMFGCLSPKLHCVITHSKKWRRRRARGGFTVRRGFLRSAGIR